MIESQFTRNIHKRLPPHIFAWKISDNFSGGVPDAFYRTLGGKGQHLWVEYKFIKALPKRSSTLIKPNLSEQQLLWLQQAVNAGEQALVIVGVENEKRQRGASGFILQPHEWEHGITQGVAFSRLKSYEELAKTITGQIVAPR